VSERREGGKHSAVCPAGVSWRDFLINFAAAARLATGKREHPGRLCPHPGGGTSRSSSCHTAAVALTQPARASACGHLPRVWIPLAVRVQPPACCRWLAPAAPRAQRPQSWCRHAHHPCQSMGLTLNLNHNLNVATSSAPMLTTWAVAHLSQCRAIHPGSACLASWVEGDSEGDSRFLHLTVSHRLPTVSFSFLQVRATVSHCLPLSP
jgi:hypothetical protein